jgi:hypothetical protein
MDCKMYELSKKAPNRERVKYGEQIAKTIRLYMGFGLSLLSEKGRQFACWGAHNYRLIFADNGYCLGLQFNVSGLKHRGRVRVWYNEGSDYFDVELLRARKDELVWGCSDIDCFQLHNVLHRQIESENDPEV